MVTQVCVSLTQPRVIWEEKISIERMPLSSWPGDKPVVISLIDVGRPSPLGWYTAEQLVLGCIRKQTEQVSK